MKTYYEIYLNGNLFHMTENVNIHQQTLDALHEKGYEPIEKKVKISGN